MEYTLCRQYVGEAETPFNIGLNNHRNYVKKPDPKTILACKKHIQEKIITSISMQNSLLHTNQPTQKT